MKIKSAILFADRQRRWQFELVEGPIERHKSRVASRETGDGLTGTYSGGSLGGTEFVAKWSRERRAHQAGEERLDEIKPCARQALTTPSVRKCN